MTTLLHETVSKNLKKKKGKQPEAVRQTEFKAAAQQKQQTQLHTLSKMKTSQENAQEIQNFCKCSQHIHNINGKNRVFFDQHFCKSNTGCCEISGEIENKTDNKILADSSDIHVCHSFMNI